MKFPGAWMTSATLKTGELEDVTFELLTPTDDVSPKAATEGKRLVA